VGRAFAGRPVDIGVYVPDPVNFCPFPQEAILPYE
jgi:hypothetical protein